MALPPQAQQAYKIGGLGKIDESLKNKVPQRERGCLRCACAHSNLPYRSLQSNRLVTIGTGFAHCTKLKELYISHNGLEDMQGP
jgi:Leucine-rich repeat (LRR) protein